MSGGGLLKLENRINRRVRTEVCEVQESKYLEAFWLPGNDIKWSGSRAGKNAYLLSIKMSTRVGYLKTIFLFSIKQQG